jgi:hypothetical protein
MKKKFEFIHRKQFGLKSGAIITMKSLITLNYPGLYKQLVTCYEDNNRYEVDDLIDISTTSNRDDFSLIDRVPAY